MDAIYFDSAEKTLFIVQSKWSKDATKSIGEADCTKFLNGIQQLIRGDFSSFNEKIRKRETELNNNLLKRSDVKVSLVIVFSSPQTLASPIEISLNQFLEQQNNVGDTEVFSLEVLNLSRLYSYLSGSATSNKIKLQIALSEWGTMQNPYRAYYGQVRLSDIAQWGVHGKPLLDKNLRFYRGATDVNDAIESTIADHPQHFWYFNNGITLLCSKIEKTLLNGDSRDYGIFDCEGVSIVNGAQTVGVIWEASNPSKTNISLQSDSRVNVRLISLENCPDGFDVEVTRATNTQNRIQHRDFAALDPTQQRIAQEMDMDGRKYAFKSGDIDPKGDLGCNIEDATVALACANSDISLAVQAKREVGQLWRDITKHPYTILFNDQLSAQNMWKAVRVLRWVSDELDIIGKDPYPRGEWVAIHGNRFILHLVFRDPGVAEFRNPDRTETTLEQSSREATRRILKQLSELVQRKYENAYLANLFKNAQKCKHLEQLMDSKEPEDLPIPRLFEDLPL
jgi:hypothetical protein